MINCAFCGGSHVWWDCRKKPEGWKPSPPAKSTAALTEVQETNLSGPVPDGTAGTQAPPVDITTRGTPRVRAPKGTFDRKAYQRELAKKRREKERSALLASIGTAAQPLVEAGNAIIAKRRAGGKAK